MEKKATDEAQKATETVVLTTPPTPLPEKAPDDPKPSTSKSTLLPKPDNVETTSTPSLATKSDFNPRIIVVNTTIENTNAQETAEQQAETMAEKLLTQGLSKDNDYLTKTDLTHQSESQKGNIFTIDVQPDFRMMFIYIINYVITIYPNFDVKASPNVTPASLIAYLQIVYIIYLLLNDLYARNKPSIWASKWKGDAKKITLLRKFLECYVPPDIFNIIKKFAALTDARRPNLEFIPSLAGFNYNHDFGRIVPPQIMLQAHNLLITQRPNTPAQHVIRRFYDTIIFNVNNMAVRISNLVGGMFVNGLALNVHENFVTKAIDTIFAPAIQRSLHLRPTIQTFPLTVQDFNPAAMDPYEALLNINNDDYLTLISFISNSSKFFHEQDNATQTIAELIQQSEGSAILSHMIDPVTLPTHHRLQVPNNDTDNAPTHVTSTAFAVHTHFLEVPPQARGVVPMPAQQVDYAHDLYRIENHIHIAAELPYSYKTYDAIRDQFPDALLCQPYQQSSYTGTVALIHGIRIEQDTIDATTIPIPNPELSLNYNNSHYIQGSIPITKIKYPQMSADVANRFFIVERVEQPLCTEAIGLAIRDMSKVIYPEFDDENVQEFDGLEGIQFETHHDEPVNAYTATAWCANAQPPIPDSSLYIWSSYRHVKKLSHAQHEVSFYYTLQALFGTNLIASKIPNASVLISSV